MSQRYELTTPQLDIKHPLETFKYKFPPVESIRTLVEENPDFMIGVLSTRRLRGIYGKSQSFTEQDIQEELFLSTRNSYDSAQIRAWNSTKEQVKFLFYDWSTRFAKGQYDTDISDLAFDAVSKFVDSNWTGDERSIYHYLSHYTQFLKLKSAPNMAYSYDDDDDRNYRVKTKLTSLKKQAITTLGYSNLSELETAESVFKNIPLSDVPRIISLLPDSLTKYLCLQRLGYLDGDKTADDLREVIQGIPAGYDIDRYLKSFLTRNVKTPLQEIIESKSYEQAANVDFADVVESIKLPLKLYFYHDNQPVRYGSYQFKLLQHASEIDPSVFRYTLTPREQAIIPQLLETDINGQIVYSPEAIANNLGIPSSMIPQYCASILHKLVGEGDTYNNPDQLYLIKTQYAIPNKWKSIAIVTDEFHIKRAAIAAYYMFGTEFTLQYVGSYLNIAGKYREVLKEHEERYYTLFKETVASKQFVPGDHEGYLKFINEYKERMKDKVQNGGNRLEPIKL